MSQVKLKEYISKFTTYLFNIVCYSKWHNNTVKKGIYGNYICMKLSQSWHTLSMIDNE